MHCVFDDCPFCHPELLEETAVRSAICKVCKKDIQITSRPEDTRHRFERHFKGPEAGVNVYCEGSMQLVVAQKDAVEPMPFDQQIRHYAKRHNLMEGDVEFMIGLMQKAIEHDRTFRVRPAVQWLADEMECRLDKFKHKAKLHRPTQQECVAKINKHLAMILTYLQEHEAALECEDEKQASDTRDYATEHAADLGNWVLLLMGQDVNVEA